MMTIMGTSDVSVWVQVYYKAEMARAIVTQTLVLIVFPNGHRTSLQYCVACYCLAKLSPRVKQQQRMRKVVCSIENSNPSILFVDEVKTRGRNTVGEQVVFLSRT